MEIFRTIGVSSFKTVLHSEENNHDPGIPREGEIILYSTPNGVAKVEVYFQSESFWLNQRRMADLFDVEVNTINYHLKEIYQSGELLPGTTIRKFRIVQTNPVSGA